MPQTVSSPAPDAPDTPDAATRAGRLAALRAQVRALEGQSRPQARLSLGDPALDARLPGGGLEWGALHTACGQVHDDQPSAAGFLLGLAGRVLQERAGALVWVRAAGAFDFGAPYGPGLAGMGLPSARVLHVRARAWKDALWAAEEALRSAGAAAVLVEPGRALATTTARRLHLAAEASGGLGLMLAAAPGARSRWRIASQASAAPDWARAAGVTGWRVPPGRPVFTAQARLSDGRISDFTMEWRHETHSFHSVAPMADRALAPRRRTG